MTIEGFQPADYILCGLTGVMAILGLFRGFSGTLAFFVAGLAAALTASLGWPFSATFVEEPWMRVVVVLVCSLLAFGLVRIIVKRLVNGLLAQPTDALFGSLIGAAFGVAILVGWAYSGFHIELSHLATTVASYLN